MINDTFKRIQVRAQAILQNTSTSTSNANDLLPKVKDWGRTRYDRIMRGFPWGELTRTYNLSVTSGTRDYSLRYDLESIIKMWDSTVGQEITEIDVRDHVRFTAPQLEVVGNVQTGNPSNYIQIGSRGVSAVLSIADQVQVLSTSALDVTPMIIRVQGEVNGILLAEDIVLTGVTAATSTNTFDAGSELLITAGTSDGTLQDLAGIVTVREKTTTANTLSQLAPNERVPEYKWIRFSVTPGSAATVQVWYKKRWYPLVNNNDAPLIPCANEIVEGIVADALWEDGQETAAQAQETKFSNGVKELWISRRPRNLIQQIVPDNEDTTGAGQRNLYNLGNTY